MATSLSNLVDNLVEEILWRLHFQISLITQHKDYSKKIDEELNKKFKSIFKFSNNDINKLILFLRKGVNPYEYMNDWEKFNETPLPEKRRILQ